MLTALKKNHRVRRSRGSFVIIASRYNARFVDAMVAAAEKKLKEAGARIQVVRVPGAYEIPVVAARLAGARRPCSALICLGVILRGQTCHAQLIAEAVTAALTQVQVQHTVPVIHEVLLLENETQAVVRCLDAKHNRGAEAAETALEMERIMASLS